MASHHVPHVRRFNRLVTQRVGALEDHFLGSDRPLGESRVLFEIGPRGADLRQLRARLNLDSGYLSRLVQSLAAKGLVRLKTDSRDERVRRASLTRAGRAEYEEMERRSDQAAEGILAPLSEPHQQRLVDAMNEVHRLLRLSGARIDVADPASPAARWCVSQYYAELGRRFESGYDPKKSIIVDDHDMIPPRGVFLLASIDGDPVACGAIRFLAPDVGWIKRMWVDTSLRGLGFGRRMLTTIEMHARTLGLTTLRLETNRALKEAIHLYETSGYKRVARFNDDPYGDHWFEKQLD